MQIQKYKNVTHSSSRHSRRASWKLLCLSDHLTLSAVSIHALALHYIPSRIPSALPSRALTKFAASTQQRAFLYGRRRTRKRHGLILILGSYTWTGRQNAAVGM